MKINVPERRSFTTDPTLPYVQPSLGQTGNAQYGRVFSPVANSLRFYTSGGEYDADSIANAQEYVNSRNDLSDAEQRRILTFGIGSQDNLAHEINFIEAQRNRQDVISRSSGLNIFITHPSLHFSLAIPYLGVSAASRLGTALRNVQGSRSGRRHWPAPDCSSRSKIWT
jgi:hypothetical protein